MTVEPSLALAAAVNVASPPLAVTLDGCSENVIDGWGTVSVPATLVSGFVVGESATTLYLSPLSAAYVSPASERVVPVAPGMSENVTPSSDFCH